MAKTSAVLSGAAARPASSAVAASAARRYLEGVLAKDADSVPGLLLLAGLDQDAGDALAAAR